MSDGAETLEALSRQLAESAPVRRRDAAERLLAMAIEGHDVTWAVDGLLEALDGPHDDIRVTVARTLLRPAIFSKTLLSYVEEPLIDGGAALVAMARCRWDRAALARILMPFLTEALSFADSSARRRRVLADIATLNRYDVDMSQTIEALIAALGDRSPKVARGAAKALRASAEQGLDISGALVALEAGLVRGGASPSNDYLLLRHGCAQTLTRFAIERGDAEAAERWVRHPDGAVREGAVIGLVPVSHPNYGAAVGALTAALDDASGAVLYFAMMRLAGAVKNGVDVSPALSRLEPLLEEPEYGGGWTFGMDDILSSDMAQEQPRADAAKILAIHHAIGRRQAPLEALLSHPSAKVRAASRKALEKLARSGDPDRRAWIRSLLEGSAT